MKATGKIIPLAFPDLFVKYSDEKRLKFLRYFGLGTKTHIKAGHAALVLVAEDGELFYFDFGRYVTPDGLGRVRNKETDAEVAIPINASFNASGEIENLKEILIWLQSNPEKTHGGGRMIASVGAVNFQEAFRYLKNLQDMGSIPYKAFGAGHEGVGTNCSRLVTETILEGISDSKIHKKLNFNKRFTPSPIGNVETTANGSAIYSVRDGEVYDYERTAFKENLVNFFDKKNAPKPDEEPTVTQPEDTDLLEGIGSNAYFRLEATQRADIFQITRFNDKGVQDFQGEFKTSQHGFSIDNPFQFVYDSNCAYCHIKQDGERFRFDVLSS